MADLKLKATFEAVDKLSPAAQKMTGVMGHLEKVFGRTKKTGSDAARAIDGLEKHEKDAAAATTRLTRVSQALDKVLGKVGSSAKAAGGHIGNFIGKFGKIGVTAAAAGAVVGAGAGVALAKNVFDVSSEFETYGATLETVLGSQQKANEALGWVQTFAAKTPYDLSQVTDAFVKLNAYGIDATGGSLEKLGNAASGMNKTLDQAVEALADAQTGEFERLKEFGIRSAQQGDKVKFTYTKAGKEISIVAKKSATNIQKALLDIFDARFDGAMVRQSKTWKGLWSNLGDQWTVFQKKIGDAGVFSHVSDDLGNFLDWLGKPENQAKVDEYATKISDALTRIYDASKNLAGVIDWPKFFNGVADGITLIAGLADALGKLYDVAEKINKSEIGRALGVMTGGNSYWVEQGVRAESDRRANEVKGRFNSINTALGRNAPMLAVPRPATGGRSFQAPQTQVGGHVTINLEGDRPRVTEVRSNNPNVPLRVRSNTGNQTGGVR